MCKRDVTKETLTVDENTSRSVANHPEGRFVDKDVDQEPAYRSDCLDYLLLAEAGLLNSWGVMSKYCLSNKHPFDKFLVKHVHQI